MLKAYINGIEYKMLGGFSITEKIGNLTESQIAVKVEDEQEIPSAGDVIEIVDAETGAAFFWGVCGIPVSPEYSTGLEPRIYTLRCGNANSILGRRKINVAYQGYTVTQIVTRLFENYVSSEGITLGLISDVAVEIEVYTGSNHNLQMALNELAELVGATWQITNDRKFYFIAPDDFPRFPHAIDAAFLSGSGLQHSTRDQKMRTVQYVAGATDITDLQVETFTYDGQTKNLVVSFGVIKQPSFVINGVPLDPAYVGINGISDSDPSVLFAFSYNSQVISYKGADFLLAGDVVEITYRGQFPIRVALYNDDKIREIAERTGTSGLIEDVYIAANVKTAGDAGNLGESLLSQFEEVSAEVKWWLLSRQLYELGEKHGVALGLADTAVLTQLTFDLPRLGIVGDYVIIERTVTPVAGKLDNYEKQLKISLRLSNRDYMKSHAQTLADIKRNVSQLVIRGEDVVVQTSYLVERERLSEEVATGVAVALYPTPVMLNGCAFSPGSFDGAYYTTPPYMPYSGRIEGSMIAYCPTAAAGALFSPVDFGEVYPI